MKDNGRQKVTDLFTWKQIILFLFGATIGIFLVSILLNLALGSVLGNDTSWMRIIVTSGITTIPSIGILFLLMVFSHVQRKIWAGICFFCSTILVTFFMINPDHKPILLFDWIVSLLFAAAGFVLLFWTRIYRRK